MRFVKYFCIAVAMFNLLYDVETTMHMSDAICSSFLGITHASEKIFRCR